LKEEKANEIDEIPGEVWKYGGEKMERWVGEFCNRIWKGESWLEEWKEGIIMPIIKKGEGEKVEEYREVTMLTSLYKVYVSVLAEKLNKELKGKRIIPQNQTGFRKDMGMIDNIYAIK